MAKKKIVIFGHSGSIHIKRWVTALVERGYAVRVISLDGDLIAGVDVIRFPRSGKLSYFKHASDAAKAALDFQPDIIHVHYAGGYGIWGKKTNFHPLVVSVWGSDIETLPKSFFYRPFIKSILNEADAITATSHSLKKSTTSFMAECENKISVIPFGVKVPSAVSEMPSSDNASAIYLKHLEKIYAPDILIQATKLVVEKFQNFRLTICGDGSLKDELLALIQELQLEKNIQMVGRIKSSEINDYILKHHFMVMPSLQEGFGVAAVEAFACCRPVIATNVGGIPEIVTNGQNGYMVDPNNVQQLANVMIKMISEKECIAKMGLNGYEVAKEKYDWEKCVDKMVAVYESF